MKSIYALLSTVLFISAPVFAANEAADELNKLVRGELAAVDTYQQALKKLGKEPGAKQLWEALDHHKDAASKLSNQVKKVNGMPATDSGAWGTWSQTIVGSAKLLGDKAALKALKEGEEHGLKEYKESLEKASVPEDVKKMVRETFIPRQEKHIAMVDQLIEKK